MPNEQLYNSYTTLQSQGFKHHPGIPTALLLWQLAQRGRKHRAQQLKQPKKKREESVAIHHVKSYDTILLLSQKSNTVHEYLTVGPITSPPNYLKIENMAAGIRMGILQKVMAVDK